eukprot:PITA_12391
MAEVTKFFTSAISAAVMITVAIATDNPEYKQDDRIRCNPIYAEANGTAFWQSLDSVLESLPQNISSDGYDISFQNKFSGVAVCRNYLTTDECSDCVKEAGRRIKALCLKYLGGWIHLDGCFLDYENHKYKSLQAEVVSAIYLCFSTNDSDPQEFSQTATALSRQLIENASANNGYATGSIDGSLYGLAQCWPPFYRKYCQQCLLQAQAQLLRCPPMVEGRGLGTSCFMRYSTYSFFSDILASNSTKSSSKIVPILLGSIVGTSLIAVVCLVSHRRIRHRKGYARKDENFGPRGNFGQVFFDYKLLRDSTGNFDRTNMLGKGGFGEVYKGTIPGGRDIAVKKLNGRHENTQAEEDFLTEVKLLTNVRHRNLVRLLGCCAQGQERLLVYEFMSNNSLHNHLFGEIRSPLSWANRLNIIVGVARGLAYLHEDSNVRIIHRDIKCGNILLDERFHPKIADFGLARFFPEDQTHVSTRVGGTIGYTAPEYAVHGQLTEKADVYSYGIVVLEIVSGRKCIDPKLPAPMSLLLQWVWNQYKHDRVLDIVDPTLEGRYPKEQVLSVITVALLCTQGSWGLRPAMSQVGLMLTKNSEIPAPPTQPAFIDAAAGSSENSNTDAKPRGSAAAPSQGSHGPISVSLVPR